MRTSSEEQILESMNQLQEATYDLKISLERCSHIKSKTEEVALIEFEALTSRFARATDILIHKVYRSIDSVEFIDGGTLIDVMNRAEKRELIDSVQEMRLFKDLRNDISHEYIKEKLQYSPKLLELVQRAHSYCQRYMPK